MQDADSPRPKQPILTSRVAWHPARAYDVRYKKWNNERTLERLKEALEAHRQTLEELESALVEFEESLFEEATLHPQKEGQRGGVQLLSIPQLCARSLLWARAESTVGCAAGRSPA